MLKFSDVLNPKELWSVGYVSMVCDDNNEWSFGGPDNSWYVWVPDDGWYVWVPNIYWRSLGSTLDSPKNVRELEKG